MRDQLKRAFWRPWGVVAIVLFAFGVYTIGIARRDLRVLEEAAASVPMDFVADLSRPGRVTAPFHHMMAMGHDDYVVAKFEPPLESTDLLDGLRARFSVTAPDGKVVLDCDADAEALSMNVMTNLFQSRLCDGIPFSAGDYTAALDITSPAPRMAGRGVRLVAGYEFCGLETFACRCVALFGAAVAGVGALIALILLFTTRPKPAAGAPGPA